LEAVDFGLITPVLPGVQWLRMPLPFRLDHINLWLLADGEGWTAVDCGYSTHPAREVWDRILAPGDGRRPVTRLMVTHCHPDHVGLAAWLAERCSVTPWMTEPEYLLARAVHQRAAGTGLAQMRELFLRHGLDPARCVAVNSPDEYYRRGVPQVPHAFCRLSDGDSIEIRGNAWRVIVGHGHSPAHASLYCERLGALISGDMVLPRITTNVSVWPMEPEADPLGQYLRSLERLAALPEGTIVLPSHGLPFRGLQDRITALRVHHAQRLERALEVCRQPRTAAQLLPELFGRDYHDEQLFFAMGEAIAHLNHLMHAGELTRATDEAGTYRFARRSPPAPKEYA